MLTLSTHTLCLYRYFEIPHEFLPAKITVKLQFIFIQLYEIFLGFFRNISRTEGKGRTQQPGDKEHIQIT